MLYGTVQHHQSEALRRDQPHGTSTPCQRISPDRRRRMQRRTRKRPTQEHFGRRYPADAVCGPAQILGWARRRNAACRGCRPPRTAAGNVDHQSWRRRPENPHGLRISGVLGIPADAGFSQFAAAAGRSRGGRPGQHADKVNGRADSGPDGERRSGRRADAWPVDGIVVRRGVAAICHAAARKRHGLVRRAQRPHRRPRFAVSTRRPCSALDRGGTRARSWLVTHGAGGTIPRGVGPGPDRVHHSLAHATRGRTYPRRSQQPRGDRGRRRLRF
jgi:hypothetical protein